MHPFPHSEQNRPRSILVNKYLYTKLISLNRYPLHIKGTHYPDVGGQTGNLDITANNEVKAGELTPAMDIFAAG
jgi:hypothetical protein